MQRDREVVETLEAVTWCETHRATVTWTRDYDQLCRVEILAPGSHWQVLRGEGATLVEAYRTCRTRWESEAVRPAWRPTVLVGVS